jgi:hypothetical protein
LPVLLPTPDASVFNDGQTVEAWAERNARERAKGYNGNGGGVPLAMRVRLLPTPEAKLSDSGPDYARADRDGSGGDDLTTVVHRSLLPTPMVDPDSANGHARNLGREASSLLPTPTSRDGKGRNQRDDTSCLPGALLPTPRATDGTKGGPNQRGSSGDLMLPSAVLFPTPAASDATGGRTSTELGGRRPSGSKRSIPLATAVDHRLLPTPTAMDSRMSGGSSPSDITLTDAIVRGRRLPSSGASTSPRSDAGSNSSNDQPPIPPNPDPEVDDDSAPPSSSG